MYAVVVVVVVVVVVSVALIYYFSYLEWFLYVVMEVSS